MSATLKKAMDFDAKLKKSQGFRLYAAVSKKQNPS